LNTVALKRVIRLGPDQFELELTTGERASMSYTHDCLLVVYREIEFLSFSLEVKGLTGLDDYLREAGFVLAEDAMVTL
jgi:hypothetical protein